MKLSASSRAYVAEQVRKEFGDELRAAEKRYDDAEKAENAVFERLEKELEKVSARWMDEFEKLMKKVGLRWNEGKGPENHAYIRVFDAGGSYDRIDRYSFVESSDTAAAKEAQSAVDAVKGQIEKAVQKALFEIEIHGKKDTLQEIVEQVIKEIKEGK